MGYLSWVRNFDFSNWPYYQEHDVYPKRILADEIYRNRKNLAFCQEHGIGLSEPTLGRPKKNYPVDKKEEDYVS